MLKTSSAPTVSTQRRGEFASCHITFAPERKVVYFEDPKVETLRKGRTYDFKLFRSFFHIFCRLFFIVSWCYLESHYRCMMGRIMKQAWFTDSLYYQRILLHTHGRTAWRPNNQFFKLIYNEKECVFGIIVKPNNYSFSWTLLRLIWFSLARIMITCILAKSCLSHFSHQCFRSELTQTECVDYSKY